MRQGHQLDQRSCTDTNQESVIMGEQVGGRTLTLTKNLHRHEANLIKFKAKFNSGGRRRKLRKPRPWQAHRAFVRLS